MTHRATLVLSLCFGLLTPLGASAQTQAPSTAPATDLPAAPSADAPATEPSADAPVAGEEAPAAAPAEEPAPVAEQAPAAAPATPAAPPSEATPPVTSYEPQPAAPAEAQGSLSLDAKSASTESPADTGEKNKADEERCSQLLAQGQTALAQAEGCGGGDAPIYAGSMIQFSQFTAPAYATLPDGNNGFYALNLYLAPRFTVSEKWALIADTTLGYEATQPDDTSERHKVWSTDTRLIATGNLGQAGGFMFGVSPRVVIPTSEPSWAADVYAGLGTGANVVRQFEVLQGLALVAGGSYVHTFSGNLTREVREGTAPTCVGLSGGADAVSVSCSAGVTRVVQDAFRATGSATLNMSSAWNVQASYLYGWNLIKPFEGDTGSTLDVPVLGGTATVDDLDENPIEDTRWRRLGSLTLAVSYQPISWLIASLQGNTSVCYDTPFGGQSALGGCAGGQMTNDFWLRNPLVNKFSTISLQMTVPVDAFIDAVTKGSDEKKTAKAKGKAKL